MQPASKSKTWANEDLSSFGQLSTAAAIPQGIVIAEPGESDDEYETIPAKQKKDKSSLFGGEEKIILVPGAKDEDVEMNDVDEKAAADETAKNAGNFLATVSDADWLRSKTSRLLDLTDDVDSHLAQATAITTISVRPTMRIISGKRDEWNEIDKQVGGEEGREKDEAQLEKELKEVGTTEEEAAIETISKSGRLFLRNLSYSTTEDDLRKYFAEHGELEEVRFFCLANGQLNQDNRLSK